MPDTDKTKKFILSLLVLILFCPLVAGAAQTTYVADLTVRGGQYFLDGKSSSFGWNSSLYFAPVVNFSGGDILIPVFNMNYRGTRDVRELVGGDTLVRQTMDYGLYTKYTRNYGKTDLSLRFAANQSLINETKDESWGSGLFDYFTLMGGAEFARGLGIHQAVLSADYYSTSFSNYASLVSEIDGDEFGQALDDSDLYAEISENAGENVLDFRGAAIGAALISEYGRTMLNYGWRIDLRNYPDQYLVKSDGSFSSSKRKDTVNTVTFSINRPVKRTMLGADTELMFFSSNQNSFDAPATKFLEDFHSYTSWRFSPVAVIYLGRRFSQLSLRGFVGATYYSSRLARNKKGGIP